jgi:hypothetical protein
MSAYPMSIMKSLRRFFIGVLCVVAVFAAAGPWCLYWLGLHGAEGKPVAPVVLASRDVQLEAWRRVRGSGIPTIVPLNPYTYTSVNGAPGPQEASTLIAWHVASDHMLQHRKYKSMLWWHFSGAALTIWLTRNWTVEQLLTEASKTP